MTLPPSTPTAGDRSYRLGAIQAELGFAPTLSVHPRRHCLTKPFERFLSSELGERLTGLLKALPASWSPYLLGGALRDLRLHPSSELRTADLDVVVGGCRTRQDLLSVLSNTGTVNSFGGVKIRLPRTDVTLDVWRIEDHVATNGAPRPTSIETLLPHCVTTVDAVALDLHSGTLFELGFLEAIRRRCIDLLEHTEPHPEFAAAQAAHVVMLIRKYRRTFGISPGVWQFLDEALATAGPDAVRGLLGAKFLSRGGVGLPRFNRECNGIIEEAATLARA